MNISDTKRTLNLIFSSFDTTKTTASPIKFGERKPFFDEKEKLKAAELLGKRFGIFTDKVNLEVEPVVIVNDLKE